MENKKHILKRVVACVVVVFVAVAATIMSGVAGIELPKWSEMFVTRASAATEYKSGYYTYTVTDGKATITDVDDSISGNVIIPSKLGGYPVTAIGDSMFKECTGLTSVTIPDSVTDIGKEAFYSCTGLKTLTIGKSVKNIDMRAFCGCNGLTKIYWNAENVNGLMYEDGSPYYYSKDVFSGAGSPGDGMNVIFGNSVKVIPTYAFYSCSGLTSITIGNSVTYIGNSAFYNCTGLKRVTISDSVTSIDGRAFSYCTRLKSVIIGKRVKSIGWDAFSGCIDLTSITIPDSVTSIGSDAFEDTAWYNTKPDGDVYAGKVYYAYKGTMPKNTRIKIKDGTKVIADYAFKGCTGLTSITIPDSATSIGYEAFYKCTGLNNVTIGSRVTSIGGCAFESCTGLTSVTIPNSVTDIGYSAFSGCTGLKSVTIGKSVTSIGHDAFKGTAWYNAQPDGDLYIGKVYYAYKGTMPRNTHIKIKDGTKEIVGYAFKGCTGLSSVIIPDSVTDIGYEAFYKCTGLTDVTIGKGVTSIVGEAFYKCTGLTSITIPVSVKSIGYNAFSYCTGLTSITIPVSVKSIGYNAFSYCTGLTEIIWNAGSVSDFSPYSEVFCKAGKAGDGINVVFGNSVKTIPANVFYVRNSSDRPKIQTISIGKNVKYIGEDAFSDCTGLIGVNITDLVAWCNITFDGYGSNPLSGARTLYVNGNPTTKITIPDSVTSIGDSAFYRCTGLKSVTIGKNVKYIGDGAFYGCTGLTGVNITDLAAWCNITFGGYGSNPLFYAKNLYVNGKLATNITIPSGVTSIGRSAFEYCSGLTSITIPDSVTSIGDSAFENCTGLKSITIGKNVKYIGEDAFYGCTGLIGVNITDLAAWCNITFDGFDSNPLPYAENLYVNGKLATNITIPSGVTSIARSAFNNCSVLTSVTIPDSVISIGDSAFYRCTGLKSITIGKNVKYIGKSVFSDCTGLTSVIIPDSVTSIGDYAFYRCTGLKSVTIGNSVTSIGYSAFGGCTGLTSVIIPDSVTSIGHDAFKGTAWYNAQPDGDVYAGKVYYAYKGKMPENTRIRIKDGTKGITNYAFYKRIGLTSVTIPDSVTSIGDGVFFLCTGLTSVTIGNSVTSIGDKAFRNCTGLTSVTIPNSVKSIGNYAFYNCIGLASVTIPDSVKSLGDFVFFNCTGLKSATIGKSVKGIGYGAFSNCSGLTSVTVPDSVTSIGKSAFYKCTGLKSATIGKHVTSIGEKAFYYCIGLTSVTIPDSVTSIGHYAFYKCTGLKSVTVGKNVKKIGGYVFNKCTGLTRINWNAEKVHGMLFIDYDDYCKDVFGGAGTAGEGIQVVFGDTVKAIPDYMFDIDGDSKRPKIKTVIIGKNVKYIGESAFSDCTGLTSITIPNSVTSIGNGAFGGCTRLTRINWNAEDVNNFVYSSVSPDYTYYYYGKVFGNAGTAGGGIKVVFGDNVKTIPTSAFSGCTGLKSVTIGKNVTSIGDYAFENCTGLKSITIPDSVKKIGRKAFGGFNAQIKFTGKPPAFSSDTFSGLKGTVLYPYKISEWKSAIKSKYGGQFTWVCYSKGKVTELKIKSMPKKTVYYQGQTANYSGLSLSAKWSDGFTAVITPDSKIYDVKISGFSSKTPGLKTVTATVGGKSVKFRLGVHKLNTFTGKKSKYPESAHNYADNLKETKTYKCTNALKLVVTFSNKTYVEKDGDYIYVNGTRYTGNQLAGKTITIKGDTLTVKLVSDSYGRGYGYSIDKIVITRVEHVNKTRITPATTAKDGTVVTACEACGKVAKKAVIYKASSVKLSRTKYTYNGKVQKPTVTVKNSKGVTLKNGTHYTVTYSSGCKNPGKYAVKVTFKGNYTGTKTLYFTIAPTTPSLTVTAGAKKAVLKWNKQVGATGYVVYIATSKTGKYSRIAVLKGNSAVSYTKTGLTTGKTYYFKVAAYTTSGGSNIYSAFSPVKAVKVK